MKTSDAVVEFEVKEAIDYAGNLWAHKVHEVNSGRECATYGNGIEGKAKAGRHASLLTGHHRAGRRAQGTCVNGEECDRDRIHVTLAEFKRTKLVDFVVLCDQHKAQVAAA